MDRLAPKFKAPSTPIWLLLWIFPMKIGDHISIKAKEYKIYTRTDRSRWLDNNKEKPKKLLNSTLKF